MSRIDSRFRELRKQGRKALIIYLTCGYPDLRTTAKLVELLDECGVDIIELGIPFSDPVADGPVIQYSSQKALRRGVNLKKVFSMVAALRKRTRIPLVIMSYANPVYRYGTDRFFRKCASAGVDGVIIPDIIVEERGDFGRMSLKHGVDLVHFISPTSGRKRRKEVYRKARGFTYVLSVSGITGPRKKFPPELRKFLCRVRKETAKPLALGFGISGPEQLKEISGYVDGYIIGSALIRMMKDSRGKVLYRKVRNFIRKFDKR